MVLGQRQQMIDHVESLGAVGIVGAADVDQLLEAAAGIVTQDGQHLDDGCGVRLDGQLVEGHGVAGDGLAGARLDQLAEPVQLLVARAIAHRSMVPVRRIFFCSCSTP